MARYAVLYFWQSTLFTTFCSDNLTGALLGELIDIYFWLILCCWLYLPEWRPSCALSAFICHSRICKDPAKLPAVPGVSWPVPPNLAEPPWFHHSPRTTERLVGLCARQMRPTLDLCVFYWLWPSVNTVAGSSSHVCWCTQTGDLSARRNIQRCRDER